MFNSLRFRRPESRSWHRWHQPHHCNTASQRCQTSQFFVPSKMVKTRSFQLNITELDKRFGQIRPPLQKWTANGWDLDDVPLFDWILNIALEIGPNPTDPSHQRVLSLVNWWPPKNHQFQLGQENPCFVWWKVRIIWCWCFSPENQHRYGKSMEIHHENRSFLELAGWKIPNLRSRRAPTDLWGLGNLTVFCVFQRCHICSWWCFPQILMSKPRSWQIAHSWWWKLCFFWLNPLSLVFRIHNCCV